MKTKKVLLIGYGSIGKKHARNLTELGVKPYILTRYPDNLNAIFLDDIDKIKNETIEYCIISSPTARHLDDLKKCTSLTNVPKKILVEKPLESTYLKGNRINDIATGHEIEIFVAYNLRFLNAFKKIKDFIKRKRDSIKLVEIVAGQDLKEWRPDQDYTHSYSAYREQGGGVDLDLSHEIDYVLWLFGPHIKDKIIYRDQISSLKIDSPDIFKLILDYETFIVDMTLDYIRKPRERYINILCEDGENLFYDFVTNTLKIDGKTLVMEDNFDKSYKKMLKSFLSPDKKYRDKFCTVEEGLRILKILEL